MSVLQPIPTIAARRDQHLQALVAERTRFRELIGKVGSGEHASTGLSRVEARTAMDLMLQGLVSEAQLGAFLIAHRIRRPLPIELAGMLDSYREHGPVLRTPGRRALSFGVPYRCCPCSPWCWPARACPWCCTAVRPCR